MTLCCQYVRKWERHVASCFTGVLFDMTVRERGRLQRKDRTRESSSNVRSLVLNPTVRGEMAKERAVIKLWLVWVLSFSMLWALCRHLTLLMSLMLCRWYQ